MLRCDRSIAMGAGQEEMGGAGLGKTAPCGRSRTRILYFHSSMLLPALCSLPRAIEILLILLGQLKPLSSVVPSQRCQNRICAPLGSTFFVPHSLSPPPATTTFVTPASQVPPGTQQWSKSAAGARGHEEAAVATRVNRERWPLGCPLSLFISLFRQDKAVA